MWLENYPTTVPQNRPYVSLFFVKWYKWEICNNNYCLFLDHSESAINFIHMLYSLYCVHLNHFQIICHLFQNTYPSKSTWQCNLLLYKCWFFLVKELFIYPDVWEGICLTVIYIIFLDKAVRNSMPFKKSHLQLNPQTCVAHISFFGFVFTRLHPV